MFKNGHFLVFLESEKFSQDILERLTSQVIRFLPISSHCIAVHAALRGRITSFAGISNVVK